jgi:hypothetical protein
LDDVVSHGKDKEEKAEEEERGAQGGDVRVFLCEPCVCDAY